MTPGSWRSLVALGIGGAVWLASSARTQEPRPLPIDLPTALKLSGVQPLAIAVAGQQIQLAAAQLRQAQVAWLPALYVGTDYYRHDGQIQDTAGNVLDASRQSFMLGVAPPGRLLALRRVPRPAGRAPDFRGCHGTRRQPRNPLSRAAGLWYAPPRTGGADSRCAWTTSDLIHEPGVAVPFRGEPEATAPPTIAPPGDILTGSLDRALGGAGRDTPPIPGNRTRFLESPPNSTKPASDPTNGPGSACGHGPLLHLAPGRAAATSPSARPSVAGGYPPAEPLAPQGLISWKVRGAAPAARAGAAAVLPTRKSGVASSPGGRWAGPSGPAQPHGQEGPCHRPRACLWPHLQNPQRSGFFKDGVLPGRRRRGATG